MAWPKGQPRPEGAGRKKGTPNKKAVELMAICEEEGIDPFRALVRLSRDGDTELKFAALKEVCQYIYPKRKALEHSGEINNPYMDMSAEELAELVRERLKQK